MDTRTSRDDWGQFGVLTTSFTTIVLPLWLPVAITLLPTAFLWWIERGRRAPTACRSCGYNLTGNVSGLCPECGTATSDRQRALLTASKRHEGTPGKGLSKDEA